MPPTRGHDLKHFQERAQKPSNHDAPHTGARLETTVRSKPLFLRLMPPTRGHDLKLYKLDHD